MSAAEHRESAVEPGWVWDGVSDLDYEHAAAVLRLPVGWLKEKAAADEIPSTVYGKHRRFTPQNIADLRLMHRRGPAPATPAVASHERQLRLDAAVRASRAAA